jgi:hypothetical protein
MTNCSSDSTSRVSTCKKSIYLTWHIFVRKLDIFPKYFLNLLSTVQILQLLSKLDEPLFAFT